jgi:predicted tellurium resistance membrane protein TerC
MFMFVHEFLFNSSLFIISTSHLFTSDSIISFFILVILEIILGVDNVIFVSIINRLPKKLHRKARLIWEVLGSLVRSILLLGLGWLLAQKGKAIFTIFDKGFDLASLFSFDSVITAGGTAKHVEIMIAAVILAMILMFSFSHIIAAFIQKHPTFKMLALSFLVMIGLSLVIEEWASEKVEDLHLKNYIYFGMAFSFVVEVLNMLMLKRQNKRVLQLDGPQLPDENDV